MEFLDPQLEEFVVKHTEEEPALLQKLNRETYAKVMMPRMLSGHLQGRVLSMLSHMIQPERILEIGTYTGYSALCFAEGLKESGKIITIDINEELESMVRSFIKEAGLEDKVDYRIGNALDIIPELKESFDIVFIDADKENYGRYYEMVIDKVRKGGYIIADNVLWSGKVLLEKEKMDKDTEAIVHFNQKVQDDPRVQNVLFPIRDGLMIARKL
jgi:caffeoyl-CoA O-methyltransferase